MDHILEYNHSKWSLERGSSWTGSEFTSCCCRQEVLPLLSFSAGSRPVSYCTPAVVCWRSSSPGGNRSLQLWRRWLHNRVKEGYTSTLFTLLIEINMIQGYILSSQSCSAQDVATFSPCWSAGNRTELNIKHAALPLALVMQINSFSLKFNSTRLTQYTLLHSSFTETHTVIIPSIKHYTNQMELTWC